MTFGLSTETIQKISTILNEYKIIDKVLIYGSRAKGNYKNGSDIDLTLLGKNIDASILLSLHQKLEESDLPYKFDISVYDKIDNKDLKDHINRVGKEFYIKK